MKAILVIDLPDDLDITLEDIKTEITLSSKDETKSMLYLKYDRVKLKPMPHKKKLDEDLFLSKNFELEFVRFDGYNKCIDDILGGEQ